MSDTTNGAVTTFVEPDIPPFYEMGEDNDLKAVTSFVIGRMYYAVPTKLQIDPRKEFKTSRDTLKLNPVFVDSVRRGTVKSPVFATVNDAGVPTVYEGRQRLRAAQELWKQGVTEAENGQTNLVPFIVRSPQDVPDMTIEQIEANKLRQSDGVRVLAEHIRNLSVGGDGVAPLSPEEIAVRLTALGEKMSHTDVRHYLKLMQVSDKGKFLLLDWIEAGKLTFTGSKKYVTGDFQDAKSKKYLITKIREQFEKDFADAVATAAPSPGTGEMGKATRQPRVGGGQGGNPVLTKTQLTLIQAHVDCPADIKAFIAFVKGDAVAQQIAAEFSQFQFLRGIDLTAKPESKKAAKEKAKAAAKARADAENENPLDA
jgi:hypothetical protein